MPPSFPGPCWQTTRPTQAGWPPRASATGTSAPGRRPQWSVQRGRCEMQHDSKRGATRGRPRTTGAQHTSVSNTGAAAAPRATIILAPCVPGTKSTWRMATGADGTSPGAAKKEAGVVSQRWGGATTVPLMHGRQCRRRRRTAPVAMRTVQVASTGRSSLPPSSGVSKA